MSNDKILERYKKIILSEQFANVDPKTVSNEALIAIIEKGCMKCSNGKTLCFYCGSYDRTRPEPELECPICFNQFKS